MVEENGDNLGQVTSTLQVKRLVCLSPPILASYVCTQHAVYLMRGSLRLRKVPKWPAGSSRVGQPRACRRTAQPGVEVRWPCFRESANVGEQPADIIAGLPATAYACMRKGLGLRAAPDILQGICWRFWSSSTRKNVAAENRLRTAVCAASTALKMAE